MFVVFVQQLSSKRSESFGLEPYGFALTPSQNSPVCERNMVRSTSTSCNSTSNSNSDSSNTGNTMAGTTVKVLDQMS